MTNSQISKDKEYRKFIDYFLYCPVCHRKNNELYLSRLYFSIDPRKIKIRKVLLKLMISSIVDDKKMILGIPCCTCFEKYFSNRSTRSFEIPSSSNHSFYRRSYNLNDLTEEEYKRLYQKFRPFLEKYLNLDISDMEKNNDLRTIMNKILNQITVFQVNQIVLEIFDNKELMNFLHYLLDTFSRI